MRGRSAALVAMIATAAWVGCSPRWPWRATGSAPWEPLPCTWRSSGLSWAGALVLAAGEEDALGRSLPAWPVFAEVRDELAEARRRGWKLVALSNSDHDLIEASIQAIGVPFEKAIVASEVGSYKPAHGHWQAFYAT